MTKCPVVKEFEEKKELTDYEAYKKMHEENGTNSKEVKEL